MTSFDSPRCVLCNKIGLVFVGPRGAEIYKPKVGPGGDSGPIIVNTLSILGELPAAVTSPRWPPRGPHLVGVFHWGVSTGVESVGVPRGAVAWQQNTAGLAAIFDCAGASVGGRGGGGRGDPPNFWGAGLRGQRISAIIRFRGRLCRPPRGGRNRG